MLWLVEALLAALFTSLTTIFAKIGIKNVNSNFATFFRTGIVIICCIIMCFITNSFSYFDNLTYKNWIFLILSGIATGCSWLCYYKAIKLGNVNKVAPIDKSSFILTSILFLIFFFEDTTKGGNTIIICMVFLSIALIFIGTLLMIDKKDEENKEGRKWIIYAIASSVFASFVSLFVKLGLTGIPSSLGTLIRTIIVFIFSSLIVIFSSDYVGVKSISLKSYLFLFLSGSATGGAWICEYYALNTPGVNPIAVSSITKLSILLTMAFSFLILKEKFSLKALLGLSLLIGGIILIILFSL